MMQPDIDISAPMKLDSQKRNNYKKYVLGLHFFCSKNIFKNMSLAYLVLLTIKLANMLMTQWSTLN